MEIVTMKRRNYENIYYYLKSLGEKEKVAAYKKVRSLKDPELNNFIDEKFKATNT